MNKNRIAWVDIVKYVCIMCVMHSHLESSVEFMEVLYRPFFLNAFLFCSGYVYHQERDFTAFLRKKTRQLLIPWLFFSVANIILAQILSFSEHGTLTEELFWNFLQIRGQGDGVWFVAALFAAFIPFYFLIRWYEKQSGRMRMCLIVSVSLLMSIISRIYAIKMDPTLLPWNDIALPWHLEYIFVAMPFMVLGYIFRLHFEVLFDRHNTKVFRWSIWGVFLCSVLLMSNTENYGFLNLVITYICHLSGVAAVISVCKIIPANRMILYIGQNTLIYFALHGKVYTLLQTLLKKGMPVLYHTILGNGIISVFFSVFLTAVLSLILIFPAYIINRWFPFAAGRRISKPF